MATLRAVTAHPENLLDHNIGIEVESMAGVMAGVMAEGMEGEAYLVIHYYCLLLD